MLLIRRRRRADEGNHVSISPHRDKALITALSPTFLIKKVLIIDSVVTATAKSYLHSRRVKPLRAVVPK